MTKIVVNRSFGGFTLSEEACKLLNCEKYDYSDIYDDENRRADPKLVAVVEELGERANGGSSQLKIIEIPDDVGDNWHISDYDGMETIHENHRSW